MGRRRRQEKSRAHLFVYGIHKVGGAVDERRARVDDLDAKKKVRGDHAMRSTYGVDIPSLNEHVVHRRGGHADCPICLDDAHISRCGNGDIDHSDTFETTGTQEMFSLLAFETSMPPR